MENRNLLEDIEKIIATNTPCDIKTVSDYEKSGVYVYKAFRVTSKDEMFIEGLTLAERQKFPNSVQTKIRISDIIGIDYELDKD